MKKLHLLLICFFVSTVALGDTCPDLTQDTRCIGTMQGGSCQGWYVQRGRVTTNSQFFQILTRNAFPFTTICQYNSGQLSLGRLGQAVPVAPYLWSTRYLAGLTFLVCVDSLQSCSFTLIG